MCQRSQDLLSEQICLERPTRDLQNHMWIKDLFKAQDRSVGSHVIEHKKHTGMSWDSTLQLTFKKPPHSECRCSIKEEEPQLSEKALKRLLSFPSFFFNLRLNFLHALQSNQCILIEWRQTQIWEASCLFSNVILNRLFFGPCHKSCGVLFPQPRVEPMPPAVGVLNLNHLTTREVPK